MLRALLENVFNPDQMKTILHRTDEWNDEKSETLSPCQSYLTQNDELIAV